MLFLQQVEVPQEIQENLRVSLYKLRDDAERQAGTVLPENPIPDEGTDPISYAKPDVLADHNCAQRPYDH